MMRTVAYDGSFAGLLSAIFFVYEYKHSDVRIINIEAAQQNIFGGIHIVDTNEEKALRVWNGLKKRISTQALEQLHRTFLSEQPDAGDKILRFAQYAFENDESIEQDYGNEAVLYVIETAKKVYREKHRMEAFVRFQQTKDDLYYATIEPDFNVLPLIAPHFGKRYADQRWLIYDVKRKYGVHYDLQEVRFVNISFTDAEGNKTDLKTILDEHEHLYQQLWQTYFASVNIAARKNMKLHIQHMPHRYWKYLTEKQPFIK